MIERQVVYLCSFYRTGANRSSGSHESVGFVGKIVNIFRARKVARELWRLGFAVICPVNNTALFDYFKPRVPDAGILDGLCELVKRSDVLYVMEEDWERSQGITLEVNEARRNGISVCFNKDELLTWREQCEYQRLEMIKNLKESLTEVSGSRTRKHQVQSPEMVMAKDGKRRSKVTPRSSQSVNTPRKQKVRSASRRKTS